MDTVYPGTEEVCVPILEKESNLSFNKDFYCGYSQNVLIQVMLHKLTTIVKVTSGSSTEASEWIDISWLYH